MAGLISNGSYVLQAGNDETVLWEGSTPTAIGSSITLSESLNNFKYIAVCEGSNNRRQIKYLTDAIPSVFVFEGCEILNWIYLFFYRYSCNENKTVLTYESNTVVSYKNTDTSVAVQQNASITGRAHFLQIIGIGRKEGV